MGAANLCWLWERLSLCASLNQRAADWLEGHTLVYIVVTIAVHDPLGIFGTAFPWFLLLVPMQCSFGWDLFLGQLWRSAAGLSLPTSSPLHQHLICVDILGLFCFSCVPGS